MGFPTTLRIQKNLLGIHTHYIVGSLLGVRLPTRMCRFFKLFLTIIILGFWEEREFIKVGFI